MKLGFKLTGLHLIIILLGSIILFATLRPIMEGFDATTNVVIKDDNINKGLTPESQMHSMLGALTDKAETLMYGHPYNVNTGGALVEGAPAGAVSTTGAALTGSTIPTVTGAPPTITAGVPTVAPPTSLLQSLSEKTNNLLNGKNQASYIGPAGDTVIVDNPRQPMPQQQQEQKQQQQQSFMGIPKSQIPTGNEDMYILKSQVVPPVCPACPTMSSCPRPAPYPPCPPCARCPEPSFDCKKIPNYRNGSENTYLPRPVLANFSQFGM